MKMYNDLFVWHQGYDDISISHQTTIYNSFIDYFLLIPIGNISITANRVKSGNLGHQVNSDIHLQTVEIQMRRLLMSRLITIFTVFYVNLFFIPITEL